MSENSLISNSSVRENSVISRQNRTNHSTSRTTAAFLKHVCRPGSSRGSVKEGHVCRPVSSRSSVKEGRVETRRWGRLLITHFYEVKQGSFPIRGKNWFGENPKRRVGVGAPGPCLRATRLPWGGGGYLSLSVLWVEKWEKGAHFDI